MSQKLTEGFVCSNLSDNFEGLSLKIPISSVEENSVKVSIKVVSLNFPDLLMTQGKYQNKPKLPFALGMEGAELSLKLVHNLALSRRVMKSCLEVGGMGRLRKKLFCQNLCFHRNQNLFLFEEAAAFKTVYLTAFVGLIRRGNLGEEKIF